MRERVCKNCGGREYKVVGQNMVKCQFCGTLYVDEHASKEEEVLLVGAYEILRAMRFDEAIEEFDNIIALFPLSFDAYFGKALAKNKIVLYTNKKGTKKRPRFFGEIVDIAEDEDFKKSMELAPQEVAKLYTETLRRVQKIKKQYEDKSSKLNFDICICCVGDDMTIAQKTYEKLKEEYSICFVQTQKEDEIYQALKTSKVFLLYALKENGYIEYKHLFDRYFYFVLQREKAKSSFIIAKDQNLKLNQLSKDLSACKSVIDINSISFLEDLKILIKKQMEETIGQAARLDTVKLETVQPDKKAYVDLDSVSPVDLGHYKVENLSVNEEAKIKWIFLSLKNGDFATAEQLTKEELEKDPYNSELLFAQLLAEKQIKTEDEFFSKISNFKETEKIDLILRYAKKEFAENFIDKWEKLVERLDNEEFYNKHILFLAGFNSPNRENFIQKAERKAVESLDEKLIENVLKCFDKTDVNRFIDFYFLLAQKSDNHDYYEKILQLDEGHFQSNVALFMQHFKTDEEKLTYQNREEIENMFKFFEENERAQFINSVVDLLLPVAFENLQKTEQQLDFYLSYVSQEEKLTAMLKHIAEEFQNMGFFKQAEKYLSIAISKNKEEAELYWQLILIKAHCKTNNELIMSNVKITQLPEWETLLVLSNDEHDEYYASFVSKNNLYKGERKPFEPDLLDKIQLKQNLEDFILRNEKILLEVSKQEEIAKGANYFNLQLEPFKKYLSLIDEISDFQAYTELQDKIKNRLDALGLSLETSVNVTHLTEKSQTIDGIYKQINLSEKKGKAAEKKQGKDKFLKKFLCAFLEFFPLAFTMFLLIVSIAVPKEVYMFFSQDFLVATLIFSTIVAMLNLAFFFIFKNKSSKKWKGVFISLFCMGFINLTLFISSFYLVPQVMQIETAKELQVLLLNAKYSDFVLTQDLDLTGIVWKGTNFSGTLDGKGFKLSNVHYGNGGFFETNNGTIQNLNFELAEQTYDNVSVFGSVAKRNAGKIENCFVEGIITVKLEDGGTFGGIVGINEGGSICNCFNNLTVEMTIKGENATIGGFVGQVIAGKGKNSLEKNANNISISATTSVKNLNLGGFAGRVGKNQKLTMSKNSNFINFVVRGTAVKVEIGGLVGHGEDKSDNNFASGKLDLNALSATGFVGGLYGVYENTNMSREVLHSYSSVEISGTIPTGAIVGQLGGRVNSCFGIGELMAVNKYIFTPAEARNCFVLAPGEVYKAELGFSNEIWNFEDGKYPTLK